MSILFFSDICNFLIFHLILIGFVDLVCGRLYGFKRDCISDSLASNVAVPF